jgi:predicted PurR-regulated permease PerM
MAVTTLVEHAGDIAGLAQSLTKLQLPPPPDWVAELPMVGERIAAHWRKLAETGTLPIPAEATSYLAGIGAWLARQAGNLGMLFVHFLLTVGLSALLYITGEQATAGMLAFARRLNPAQGECTLRLAAQAVRAVAMGVVVTALAQSILGGIGLAISGVPQAALLTAAMFILGVAQIGAGPVLALSVVWLYWQGDPLWGTVLLVWTLIVVSMDNVLRPILIRRGADLPLLLIFAGVIGGLFAFGIIGLFVGPVVLAVAYTLLSSWVAESETSGTACMPPSVTPAPEPRDAAAPG